MRAQYAQFERNLWIPPLAVASNWAIIASAIAIAQYVGSWPVTVLSIIVIGARQHALFVMMHEATHGNMARNRLVNDWVSDLFCALPMLVDTSVYRKNHLAHHRNLNTDQDPDWARKQGRPGWTFPVRASRLALFAPLFIGILGPLEIAPIFWFFSGFGDRNRWRTETGFLMFKLGYFVAAACAITAFGAWASVALYWFVPMMFVLPAIGRWRNLTEHFALTYEDEFNSTRETTAPWLEGFLFTPHNVNLHITHHLYPHVPFYRLKEVHQRLVESGVYANAHINGSYFIPYKNSVLRDVIEGPRPKSRVEADVRKAA